MNYPNPVPVIVTFGTGFAYAYDQSVDRNTILALDDKCVTVGYVELRVGYLNVVCVNCNIDELLAVEDFVLLLHDALEYLIIDLALKCFRRSSIEVERSELSLGVQIVQSERSNKNWFVVPLRST